MSNVDSHDHEVLLRRVEELSRTVERLQAELGTQQGDRPHARLDAGPVGSRREVLKLAGGVAAGVLAGGVMAGAAQPAAAATGQSLVLGNFQAASNITYIANGTSDRKSVV